MKKINILVLGLMTLIGCNQGYQIEVDSLTSTLSVSLDAVSAITTPGSHPVTGICAPDGSFITVDCGAGASSSVACTNGIFSIPAVMVSSIPATCTATSMDSDGTTLASDAETTGVPSYVSVVALTDLSPDAISMDFSGSLDEDANANVPAPAVHQSTFTLQDGSLTSVTLSGESGVDISAAEITLLESVGLFNCAGTYDMLTGCMKNLPDVGGTELPNPALAYQIEVTHKFDAEGLGAFVSSSPQLIDTYSIITSDNQTESNDLSNLPMTNYSTMGGISELSPSITSGNITSFLPLVNGSIYSAGTNSGMFVALDNFELYQYETVGGQTVTVSPAELILIADNPSAAGISNAMTNIFPEITMLYGQSTLVNSIGHNSEFSYRYSNYFKTSIDYPIAMWLRHESNTNFWYKVVIVENPIARR